MIAALSWAQLAFALFVVVVIAERAQALLLAAPISADAARWLTESLSRGELGVVRRWSLLRSPTYVAQVLSTGLSERAESPEEGLAELLLDLKDAATKRLMLLRASATLASSLGLLAAIVAIRHGFGGDSGLLALQAGLAERLSIAHALWSMAVGVGTSAVCFFALSIFRRRAWELVAQSRRFAHLVASRPGKFEPATG